MITEFDFIKKYLSSKEKNSKYSLNFKDDVGLVDGKIYSTDTICEDIHLAKDYFSKLTQRQSRAVILPSPHHTLKSYNVSLRQIYK